MKTADILKAVLTNVADHKSYVISEEMVICKYLRVDSATSATSERAFSDGKNGDIARSEHHEPTKALSCGYIANQQYK